MILENGAEAEDELRRAIDARPPLMQRIALDLVLRAVRRQRMAIADNPDPAMPAPLAADPPSQETLRRIA